MKEARRHRLLPLRSRRTPRALVATSLGLLLAACLPATISDELVIEISADGSARATILTRLPGDEADEDSEKAIRQYDEAFQRGNDPWRDTIREAAPGRERLVAERVKGRLVRVERTLAFADLTRVATLFRGDAVQAGVTLDEERGELWLVPSGSLAEGDDLERVAAARKELVARSASYIEATGAIYRWLEQHPERSEAVFAALFEDLLPEHERQPELPFPAEGNADETALFDAYEETISELVDLLFDERPLEWASRRVFHPLRERVTVRLPAPPVEVEGFVPAGNGAWTVPETSFVAAIERASAELVSPLPLVEMSRELAFPASPDAPREPLSSWLARPRHAEPLPADLAERIDDALRGPAGWRLVWPRPQHSPHP